MHRDRGVSAAAVPGDRKRIGEPMDRSSPSTSWGFSGGREKERIGGGKQPEMSRSGGGSTAISKSMLFDGERCLPLCFHYIVGCFICSISKFLRPAGGGFVCG